MYSLFRRTLCTLMTVGLLSACVSNAPPPRLALGESIAIQPPVINRLDVKVDSKTKRRSKGVVLGTLGAVGGAAVGAVSGAVFGMACGPAAVLCAPLGAVVGAGVGLVGGGAMGGAYAGRGGISGEKAKQFNEAATHLIDEDGLELKLHKRFVASAGSHWVIEGNSSNTAKLVVGSLRFAQERGDNVRLVLDVEMDVNLGGRAETFEFKYAGKLRHVDDWLANDGERFQLEIDTAIEEVTRKMIVSLVPGPRLAEVGES